jgi:hypothetical protein
MRPPYSAAVRSRKDVANFFLGFLGGIVAWFAVNLVGQPLVNFLNARSEAARALAQFDYLDRGDPTIDDPSPEITQERRKLLSSAGAQLVAFAHANQFLAVTLRKLKLWPQHAGNALILLSQLKPYGSNNEEIREQVMRQLRLGKRFGPHHRV